MKLRFLALVCVLLLVLTISPAVFAAEDDVPALSSAPYYGEFSGTVKSITSWLDPDGNESKALLVLLENEEGGQASFIVDQATHMLTKNELKEGSRATGYFRNNLPMALIYPPRYNALLLAVDIPQGQFIKVAQFDDELISDDNTLKLNIGEKTAIVLFDGENAPEDLELGGLRLAVFYKASTRSIPAITTPERIIVLALADAVPLEEVEEAEPELDGLPLVVEGELLADAPPVYMLEDGTVMIPLRVVAEVLGYEVGWHVGQVVSLGEVKVLTIGSTECTAIDESAVKLEAAPVLYESRTYVPLAFFKAVLKVNNAYVFEGQVLINNDEIVE
jgi:hypothetical protein